MNIAELMINFFTILTTLQVRRTNGQEDDYNYNTQYGPPNVMPFIVGGSKQTIENYPYQAEIEIRKEHFCGGSIIAATWVLTASHCILGQSNSDYIIRTGNNLSEKGGHESLVRNVHKHPGYNDATQENDIALIEVTANFYIGSPGVDIVNLANNLPAPGEYITVSGWGQLGEYQPYRPFTHLRAAHLPVLEQSECVDIYQQEFFPEMMFCAGFDEGKKDACFGDSGGPAVNKYGELVGVVSWGHGCARARRPGVFTIVLKYKDWINGIINQNQNQKRIQNSNFC